MRILIAHENVNKKPILLLLEKCGKIIHSLLNQNDEIKDKPQFTTALKSIDSYVSSYDNMKVQNKERKTELNEVELLKIHDAQMKNQNVFTAENHLPM